MAEGAEQKKASSKFKYGCIGALAVVVLLIVIGMIAGPETPPGTSSPEAASSAGGSQTKPVVEITSRELAQAYENNEMRAKQQFDGKVLKVTGRVQGVDTDLTDDPILRLDGVNEFLNVQASFTKDDADKMAALNKGDKVTVTCESITEIMSMPVMNDCSI